MQTKMALLAGEVAELKADKLRLAEENKVLHSRKLILEKLVALKEEQIQVLENAAGGVCLPSCL